MPERRRGRPPKARDAEDTEPQKSRKRPQGSATSSGTVATIDRTVKKRKAEETATKHISSSTSGPGPHTDMLLHGCTCDNCEWRYFSGIRYKCAVCEDYDLCSTCYGRNVHDLSHPFMQIFKQGGQPTYLPARSMASNSNPSSTVSQHFTACEQVTSPSSTPFFYNTMSTAELKTFLMERGVEFGDVLDNQALCRRAWDTYCDCMTFVELNTFLSARGISTVGCKDVNSRRQRAKYAFQPPIARPPACSDASAIRFRKDDMVVLTGLNRVEMNGKTAKVISVNYSERKAVVKVEVLEQSFKVKLENLKMLGGDEVVEELE